MLIAWGISEQLDQLKLTYHGLPDFLTALVQQELDRIPRELSNEQRRQLWSIVYMPQVLWHARHIKQRKHCNIWRDRACCCHRHISDEMVMYEFSRTVLQGSVSRAWEFLAQTGVCEAIMRGFFLSQAGSEVWVAV